MYGESSKNRFCTSFQYDLQSAHLHEFSNGFRRESAGGVLYKVHSQLGQMYSTSEEKSELGVPYGNMHLGDSLRYYAPGDFDCKYEGIAVLCT